MSLAFIIMVFSCASVPENINLLSLDIAIAAAAEQLSTDLEEKIVAVVAFGSGSEALSVYIIEELTRALVSSRTVTVVDRRELDIVREELQFNLSGEVSDESAQALGRMLGAQSVITGVLTDLRSSFRFSVKAINVESATVESMPGFDVRINDRRIVHFMGQSSSTTLSAPQITQRVMPRDLADVFGTVGVADTFNALHAFLQSCNESTNDRRERINRQILLGDWIDLPNLTVQGGTGGGAIATYNIDLGENGKLLRLIVVGIDSFITTNKDAPAHVVFQFQNIPGTRRMNDSNHNVYRESEMRRYLTTSFMRGLIAAGVPENILYAPTRHIVAGAGFSREMVISDLVWLPTMWELFGFQYFTFETAENQARLEYYQDSFQRIKYNASGEAVFWWTSSPVAFADSTSATLGNFNTVGTVGHSDLGMWFEGDPGPGHPASSSTVDHYRHRPIGFAPAFAIR